MTVKGHDTALASIRKRVFSLPTLLSFLIAIAFIFFLATRFEIDWGETWANVRAMNPWLYLTGFLCYYASFWFRGLRWRIIARNAGIRDAGDGHLPSTNKLASLILIGWFVNSIAWLRLGDAYRAYGLSEESGRAFSWSLGTVLAERVMDMALIFALILAAVVTLALTVGSVGTGLIVAASFLMAFALGALMLFMRVYGSRVARFLPVRLQRSYGRFHEGTLGSFKQLPALTALGLAGWVLEMARLYFVTQALGIDLNVLWVIIAALGHAILSSVPTPGGVGFVEPGIATLLTLTHRIERHDAVSVTLVDRSITYLSVIAVGGIVFLVRQIMLSRQRRG
jgi:hypothetical protein